MAERERQEALDKLADIDVHRNSFYFFFAFEDFSLELEIQLGNMVYFGFSNKNCLRLNEFHYIY